MTRFAKVNFIYSDEVIENTEQLGINDADAQIYAILQSPSIPTNSFRERAYEM
ncbi:hypothetical protein [Thalassobacillus sp. C254]|uniref:hypothetical protein n=1 Tax=Thalassobacillus sp. C254 TaxID=1225341 RepID=UPI0012EE2154|nr:hypothetical protein [Thalassobacillus sp. C254]